MKPILPVLLVFLCVLKTKSQVAFTYFPFQSIICVSSNTERLAWVDLKLETNTFFTNMNMELSPKIHLNTTEQANYYIGPGVNFNPVYAAADLPIVNGYFVDLGVRIKPLKTLKSLQIVFEISPYINEHLAGGNLRTRLGVAYNFTRKPKTQN